MGDGGKGSSPRPFCISQEEYDNRWDVIFGRDLKESVPEKEDKVTRNNEETQEVLKDSK